MGIRDHLSLFSGIGGLDIAAEWAGFRTVAFVERDAYCQRVLAKHWPGVPIFDDVRRVVADSDGGLRHEPDEAVCTGRNQPCGEREGAEVAADAAGAQLQEKRGGNEGEGRETGGFGMGGRIGLLTGGFPCQPHSVAGKRQASGDERDLWDECARITGEFRPRWAVFENVPGLLSSEGGTFFARILGDLASLGYRVGWGVWGADDVGALHRRDRVFIVAHSARDVRAEQEESRAVWERAWEGGQSIVREDVADADDQGSQGRQREGVRERAGEQTTGAGSAWRSTADGSCWLSEPAVGRVAHGVSRRVDRLRALGNAVVPQQAFPLLHAIAKAEGIAP